VEPGSDPLATTFRSNPAVLSDPDLKIAMLPGCEFAGARVRNVGNAAVRSGAAAVAFFVEGQLAGEIPIGVPLDRGAAVDVRLTLPFPALGAVHAEIVALLGLHECSTANDVGAAVSYP
jgi:hypothetical protein